jgi:hypothetical protein
MTAAATPAGAHAAPGRGRTTVIIAAAVIAAVVAVVAFLAVTVTGQSGQIGALRGQVATAQHAADAASAKANAAAGTRSAAATAHLGVCVATSYNSDAGASWVQSVAVTAPVLVSGVASCPSGTFVPVSPQPGGQPAS